MRLESLADVTEQILPLTPSMTELDVAQLIMTLHQNPGAGTDILAAYQAADPETRADAWYAVWTILTAASTVANVITSIASAVVLA